jgi:hypothetical protein
MYLLSWPLSLLPELARWNRFVLLARDSRYKLGLCLLGWDRHTISLKDRLEPLYEPTIHRLVVRNLNLAQGHLLLLLLLS